MTSPDLKLPLENVQNDMIHIQGENGDSPQKKPLPRGALPTQEDAEDLSQDDEYGGESSEESEDDQNLDPDTKQDNYMKGFLKNLLDVGPQSKAILNYSYPPLLYHRGDDSEDDGDMDDS